MSQPIRRSEMPVRPSVVPLVSCALLAGLLNVATATLRRPTIHREEIGALLAFVSVGVALALLAEATLWMLARPWIRRQALAAPATSLAIGVGVVALAAVSPLWSSVSQMGSPERWAVLLALLGGVCLASLWSYGLAAGASDRLLALGDAVALAAPGIGAGALACVWVLVFRIGDLTSAASLLSLLAFAGGVAVCLAVAARARECVSRSGTLIAILVGVLALPWLWVYLPGRSVARPVPSAESPSVLFVTVDTLRADAVDLAAGNPRTPALARLAAEAIVFERARSSGPWTKVGIASLLSGLSPLVHNVTERESRLPDEVRTLTEYLAERGYRTGAVGYSPLLAPNANFDQGFESYLFFPRSPGSSFGGIVLPALSPQRFGRERATSAELREMAVDWIDEHRDEPFFFWLHYFDPHLPYHPPAELRPQGNAPPRVGVRFDGRSAIRNGDLVLDDADKAWVRALYDAEVRDVDAQIGHLLDALREFGLYERTLIVFTSDHGEEFFEHGDFEHGHSVHDEVLRVPLILKPPGAATPRRIATSVSIVSAVPTLLDLLDFGAAAGPFSAPSLGPLVAGERNESAAHVSTGMIYYENKTALIVDDSKYVRAESGTEEFFDLEADPDERTSLAGSSPERVREARELLDRKIAEAAALRRELGLPANSRLEPDREWVENLRALGYVE